MKTCSRCGVEKPIDRFGKRRDAHDGHDGTCKDCRATQARTANSCPSRRALVRAACRRWRARNRDRENERARLHYLGNRDRSAVTAKNWAARNPGRKRDILRQWRAENSAQAAILNARASGLRRARVAAVNAEPIDRYIVFERDKWICGICHKHVERAEASVDHIVPIARGGSHTYDNCQAAHLKCNLSKGAKLRETAA